MKILGITAEYNPFHNGHLYHINKSKKKIKPDYTVIVMSGNFVQRGAPAIYNKWERAMHAVSFGADLVVELPVRFSMSSAESFAYGAVHLLNSLGVTDISFGAENDISELIELYKSYKLADDNGKLNEAVKKSITFEEARQKALCDKTILSMSNNILGFEYVKAVRIINPDIVLHTIKRHIINHDSSQVTADLASASKIRELLIAGENASAFVPYPVSHSHKAHADLFTSAIKYAIITKSPQELRDYAEIREGLENRIYKCAFSDASFDTLVKEIKSKRYTYSAISRMLFSVLLGLKKAKDSHPEYIRVLAANQKGTELIKNIKRSSPVPVITKATEIYNYNDAVICQAEEDFLASDIYFNFTQRQKNGKTDLTTSPIIL